MKQETRHYYDQTTLNLANHIVRQSMRHNDMAVGARASAYACVLLCRLMANHDKPQATLEKLSEVEENLLNDIFDHAETCVEAHTKGERVDNLVRQLVRMAERAQQHRQKRQRPQKKYSQSRNRTPHNQRR